MNFQPGSVSDAEGISLLEMVEAEQGGISDIVEISLLEEIVGTEEEISDTVEISLPEEISDTVEISLLEEISDTVEIYRPEEISLLGVFYVVGTLTLEMIYQRTAETLLDVAALLGVSVIPSYFVCSTFLGLSC